MDAGDEDVATSRADELENWQVAALKLLTISDEACRSIGFTVNDEDNLKAIAVMAAAFADPDELEEPDDPVPLPHLPHSLCSALVPPSVLCVQPKTNTPRVGCTLRSLSHHIALLPGIGTVETNWRFAFIDPDVPDDERPLNLLLVPLPYRLHAGDFRPAGHFADRDNRFFTLSPGWLHEGGKADHGAAKVPSSKIADFLLDLVRQARRDCADVHGIVMPETALYADQAAGVASILATHPEASALELFITGVIRQEGDRFINEAATFRFTEDEPQNWSQAKHHRWRLERSQIRQYHLGHVLNPGCYWWEQIDVGHRTCNFTVVRQDTTLSVLVCEDLARVDPVLPAINAVGPNLVVALLMDGPQMEKRWPGRYATVLAEDPGSSVLTLTSLGMIGRSHDPGMPQVRQIALWKEPGGAAQELSLGQGDHALLLSLAAERWKMTSLDLREDGGRSRRLRFAAAHAVRLDGSGTRYGAWLRLP